MSSKKNNRSRTPSPRFVDYSDQSDADDRSLSRNSKYDPLEINLVDMNLDQGYYWLGKDYSNSYVADFDNVADYSSDQFERTKVQRMPWRDEGVVVFGESARDLARHFIQRWNHAKVF